MIHYKDNTGKALVLVLATMAVLVYYYISQPQTKESGGYGPDGTNYYHLYQHYKGEKDIGKIYWPFNKRPGTPWLASKLSVNSTQAFLAVNLVAGLLVIIFCFEALKKLPAVALFACLVPTFFYLHSSIRYPFFYPYTADPPAIACYALAALLVTKEKYWWALSALSVSCVFREQGVYFALTLGPALWAVKARKAGPCLAMMAYALTGLLINSLAQYPNPFYSEVLHSNQVDVLVSFIKIRLGTAEGLPVALTAISHTLAPFAFAAPAALQWRKDKPDSATAVSFIWLLVCLGMALFGGGEVARIFSMGLPLYIIFWGNLIKNYPPMVIIYFIIAGLIANSFLSPLSVNLHDWWVPKTFDYLTGRLLPMTFSFFLFWILVYSLAWLLMRKDLRKP